MYPERPLLIFRRLRSSAQAQDEQHAEIDSVAHPVEPSAYGLGAKPSDRAEAQQLQDDQHHHQGGQHLFYRLPPRLYSVAGKAQREADETGVAERLGDSLKRLLWYEPVPVALQLSIGHEPLPRIEPDRVEEESPCHCAVLL